jgi:response regulator of citrate/malate metabolism
MRGVDDMVSKSALVVSTDVHRRSDYTLALAEVFDVVHEASTFVEAKTVLVEKRPDVLVAEVQLREFNGIHLVLWSQDRLPDLLSVIVGDSDVVLERDAHAAGAAYRHHGDMKGIVAAAQETRSTRNRTAS